MNFIKRKKQDKIYWIPSTQLGEIKFTFDKIKIYEFYKDYPQELSDEEIEIFKRENPTLAELRD